MLHHIRMGKLAGWRPRGHHERVRESCMMSFVWYKLGDQNLPYRLSADRKKSPKHLSSPYTRRLCVLPGFGESGQLGQGSNASIGMDLGTMGDALPAIDLGESKKAAAVAAGGTHTCAGKVCVAHMEGMRSVGLRAGWAFCVAEEADLPKLVFFVEV